MDRWVLSFMQSLLGFFETEMAGESLWAVPLGIRTNFFFSLKLSFWYFNFSFVNVEISKLWQMAGKSLSNLQI